MKFGVNTFIWGSSFGPSDFHRLPGIKKAGFDGIEFPILAPSELQGAAIRRALADHGLECTAVSIVHRGTSLASADPGVRKPALAHMTAAIVAAQEAGATLFSGPFYTPVGQMTGVRRTSDEWKHLVESWQTLAPVVRASNLQIGLEPLNRFETYCLNTVDDAVALCDAIGEPAIGILLDTFHANIEEKHIGPAVRRAARHLKHLHACENDRGTPGSGHVAWQEFFDAVAEIEYDGWMTIESFGFALGEMSAAAAIWRDLASSPDAIAFEGVTFLRDEVARRARR